MLLSVCIAIIVWGSLTSNGIDLFEPIGINIAEGMVKLNVLVIVLSPTNTRNILTTLFPPVVHYRHCHAPTSTTDPRERPVYRLQDVL